MTLSIDCNVACTQLAERVRCLKAKSLPSLLREFALPIEDTDKIFASQWLSDEEVICGTKCNQVSIAK